ncbi:MAG: hypothetical protein ACR2KX_20420 [Chitinophagaceae bacterium]
MPNIFFYLNDNNIPKQLMALNPIPDTFKSSGSASGLTKNKGSTLKSGIGTLKINPGFELF